MSTQGDEESSGDRYATLRYLMRMKAPLDRIRERMQNEGFTSQEIETFFDAFASTPSLLAPPSPRSSQENIETNSFLETSNRKYSSADNTSALIKAVPKPRTASADPRPKGVETQVVGDSKTAAFYANLLEKKRLDKLAEQEALANLNPEERDLQLQAMEQRKHHLDQKSDHYTQMSSHFMRSSQRAASVDRRASRRQTSLLRPSSERSLSLLISSSSISPTQGLTRPVSARPLGHSQLD